MNELKNAEKANEDLEQDVVELKEELNSTKSALNLVTNDKNQNDKIIELLNQ
jgi:hypothetical protein